MLLKLLKEMTASRRVLLLGYGREGRAVGRRLLSVGGYAALGIADRNPVADAPAGAVLHIGETYQDAMRDYDIVFKSPGIVLTEGHRPQELSCRVTSLTELFLSAYRDQCIGITGTKGKSTVSSLLYHVLQTAGVPSVLGGNIGIPLADLYEQITPETVIVMEIGVHQLEYNRQSPKTAVLLNLYEEHLDHYGTMEYYAYCKENIYRNQQQGDLLVCGVPGLPAAGDCKATVLRLAQDDESAEISLLHGCIAKSGREKLVLPDDLPLTGVHNRYNCAAVFALARRLGVCAEAILCGFHSFQPLPHRLSPIGTFHGIRWVDDSISTACETCIQALNSLPDTDTVLIGGMDRGISYEPLLRYLAASPVPHIILMSDSGRRIMAEAEAYPDGLLHRMVYAEDLSAAVCMAKQITEKGKICLLSPAAASYNVYQNFEKRGEHFAQLARAESGSGGTI
ncbi:MAG: UDP-N-acetylmuramoyl-L-alanine--D-glutamate ligase [Oscillospiraceae bacterium]|nr:UDP-N-acetylmuramoyl-L-alanine--D-glutamate ligase [Oscillospiraceae bacterium]